MSQSNRPSMLSHITYYVGVTLNSASDYRTNGHYRTPNPKPNLTLTLVR